jgi:beta-glucosidase
MAADGSVKAKVSVTNTGLYDGDEIVQLYIHDIYSSMTRPVKELKAFKKVHVKSGETVDVEFEITPDMLSWYYMDPFGQNISSPKKTLEPGDFEVMAGPDSRNLQTLILNVSDK